ncbi:hypothetical protein BU17DRAFT_43922 [Hysterangium stoloniferum]|nr:hypothetical protein BU17DRAFT_43922 [Hysterangium stoloniferum]
MIHHNSQLAEGSSRHSTDTDTPNSPPQLNYTLHNSSRLRAISLFFTIIFLETGILPLIIFYALKLGAHLSSTKNLAIVTSIVGTYSGYKFAKRMWHLWIAKNSFESRPIGAGRWGVDASQVVLSFAMFAFFTPLVVGSSLSPASPATVSMALPCVMLTLGLPLLLTGLLPHRLRLPFRVSSLPANEPLPPFTFTFVEDIVAVDGGAGLAFRKAWRARYEASTVMRKLLRDQALFWGAGGCTAAAAIISVSWTTMEDVAYGVGYGVPWVWAIVWTCISVILVKRELKKERMVWMVRPFVHQMSLHIREGKPEPKEHGV